MEETEKGEESVCEREVPLTATPQHETEIWIYYIGCSVGALVAALVFRVTNWSTEYAQKQEDAAEARGVPLALYQNLTEEPR